MNKLSCYIAVPLFMASLSITTSSAAEPYIGFSFGQASVDDFCDGIPSDVSCDDSDSAFKIFGGYKLNKNFAFEASYIDFGQAVATDGFDTLTFEPTGFNFSLLGLIPVSNTVDFFGKVGLLFWDAKIAASSGTSYRSRDDDGTDLNFGAGVNFNASEQFSLRAEFQRFNNIGDETITGEFAVTLLTVAGILRF